MSTNVATFTDYNPGRLRQKLRRTPVEPQPFGVLDDLADAIEAIHQCANQAGFSERPRAFVFALATLARSRGQEQVALYDKELAELQNCSTRTVQRQRADYILEAKKKKFDLVEIVEGEFNKTTGENDPTLYRFHIGDVIEQIVTEARATPGWHELSRRRQREAIKRSSAILAEDIGISESKGRKKARPRLATAEIETCQKVIETKFRSLKDKTSKLPFVVREQLMNAEEPGQLRRWWLEVRADMDNFFSVNSAQPADAEEVNIGGRQFVGGGVAANKEAEVAVRDKEEDTRTHTEEPEREPTPEDKAIWDRAFGCLSRPKVVRAEVEVKARSPEESPPPSELEYRFDDLPEEPACFTENDIMSDLNSDIMSDLPADETDDERAEREAVEAEGCGQLPRFEVGAEVFPITIIGERLHDEPSPVAEIRPSSSGWQYRLEGFSEWRDEGLLNE